MSEFVLNEALKSQIDGWLQKYPEDQKQSALIPALHLVQEQEGWLSEPAMEAIADYLGLPTIAVHEVATFYTMYDLKPRGKNKVSICTNISCMLCGSKKIADHLKDRLGVQFGETTEDGKFTLEEVECLAACCNAPMMQINKTYYENLTPEKVDQILEAHEG